MQALTGAHSLYLTSDTAGYLVRASVLYAITCAGLYRDRGHAGAFGSNATMSYAELDQSGFPTGRQRRVAGSVAKPLGIAPPRRLRGFCD